MNPEKFREDAHQIDEYDRRQEFGSLHGDGESELTRLRRENGELKGEILMLKGAMNYLETSKIPWLEREVERLRQEVWGR